MNPNTIIALGALFVSVITTILMLMGQRHTASTDYVKQLEDQIDNLARELREAEEKIQVLEDQVALLLKEKMTLLEKLVARVA
jgi:peptidoglycan hydrolase CwlO-like protein